MVDLEVGLLVGDSMTLRDRDLEETTVSVQDREVTLGQRPKKDTDA